MNMVIISTV